MENKAEEMQGGVPLYLCNRQSSDSQNMNPG